MCNKSAVVFAFVNVITILSKFRNHCHVGRLQFIVLSLRLYISVEHFRYGFFFFFFFFLKQL